MEDITDSYYKHMKKISEESEIENLGEYHNSFVQIYIYIYIYIYCYLMYLKIFGIFV